MAYALGPGVRVNLKEAYKWLALAEAGFASAEAKRGAHIARRGGGELVLFKNLASAFEREWKASRGLSYRGDCLIKIQHPL